MRLALIMSSPVRGWPYLRMVALIMSSVRPAAFLTWRRLRCFTVSVVAVDLRSVVHAHGDAVEGADGRRMCQGHGSRCVALLAEERQVEDKLRQR